MLLRDALGEALRDARTQQNRTLRDVSTAANVSLGYLSEVERGRKEASSELLASICDALDVDLSEVLSRVSTSMRSTQTGASKHLHSAGRASVSNAVPGARVDPSLRIVVPYAASRSGAAIR